jgi:TonB family protein
MVPWIDLAGWTLLHFVWQGTAIGIIAAVGFWLLRGSAPHTRYALASAAMVTLLIAPLATAARLSSSGSVVADPRHVTSAISLAPTLVSDPASRAESTTPAIQKTAARPRVDAVLRAIVLLWLAGVAVLQLRLIGGWWRVRGLHRASLAAIPSAWQTRAELLATRLGLRQLVRVVEAGAVDIPSLIGWWRPVILLPVGALAGLSPAQADAILVHELVHIRRHDYLVNGLQHVAETLLFYHPAVWWVSRRMRIEREHCCDAVVVQICGDPIDYAVALVELEAGRSARPALAVAATDGSLVQRIRMMLSARPSHRRPLADALVTALVVAVLVVVAGGGYRWPARATGAGLQAAVVVQRVAAAPDNVVVTVNGEATTDGDRGQRQKAVRPDQPEAFRAQNMPQGRADVPQTVPAPPRAPDWQVYTTDHFEIFFKAGLNADAQRAEREAERAYRRLSSDLRHDLSMRPNLVLFATSGERDRAAASGGLPGTQVRTLLALDRPDDRFQADVVHEVTHLFEFDILPGAVLNAGPAWIPEGLAEHEGEVWAAGDEDLLRGLVRSNSVPALTTFDDRAPQRMSYSLGHAAFDFITARWGMDGIRRLLFTLRQRRAADRGGLYPAALDISAEEFDQAFERYLRERFPTASITMPSLGNVADFCCPDYLIRMVDSIRDHWHHDVGITGATIVKFTIQRDGTLTDVGAELSSGDQSLDSSAIGAVLVTRQLAPLPAAFPSSTLTVHLGFQYKP